MVIAPSSAASWPAAFWTAARDGRAIWRSVLALLLLSGIHCHGQDVAGAAEERNETVKSPNLVFILVDDLGKEWIRSFGAEGIETPRLDAMAAEGMRMTNVYSMPQCTPSRVALLTGQYPYRNGWVNHWDVPRWGAGCHFDPSQYPYVLGKAIRDAGYATAIAGKWQIDDFRVEPNALDEAGFDDWCMWTGGEAGVPASDKRYWDPYVARRGKPSETLKGKFGPDVYNQFVLDFISEHQEKPFFVYYPMALVHGPLVATPHDPEATGKLPRHRAMVRYMDYLVGRLIDHLRDLKLDRDTIVIWTTDNGTSRSITGTLDGRTVRGGKAQTTENGVNAPTIVWGPGRIPAQTVSDALVDFTDFLPTLAELAGRPVDRSAQIDGRSVASVLVGDQESSGREWILAMGGQNNAAVTPAGVENQWHFRDRVFRNERYKVFIGPDRKPEKLVDLRNDLDETQNLIGQADADAQAFLQTVQSTVSGMLSQDKDPLYQPNPEQPWDRPVEHRSQVWKKGRP
ncbi:sulfatase-like hydrolase/transferase [Roseiconus nitratireducens]|uniref:Sulfatase-like hydrolase/transferase n=1 Tax=Roseiconus nitratireducens TaxID=2605748 RepID=A0A5M6DI45_9BACT|nr:sulfatase-like hydrolase/transferase [Roseiconus nitratireducens]KAA5547227.1 sulfatase-like hydrolase/transferase [Roseiconus nitratireducens]